MARVKVAAISWIVMVHLTVVQIENVASIAGVGSDALIILTALVSSSAVQYQMNHSAYVSSPVRVSVKM